MEDNYTISTSIMQYLDEIKSYAKENHATKDKRDLDSNLEREPNDYDSQKAVRFDSGKSNKDSQHFDSDVFESDKDTAQI